jgi:hypothetical protein
MTAVIAEGKVSSGFQSPPLNGESEDVMSGRSMESEPIAIEVGCSFTSARSGPSGEA